MLPVRIAVPYWRGAQQHGSERSHELDGMVLRQSLVERVALAAGGQLLPHAHSAGRPPGASVKWLWWRPEGWLISRSGS